MIANLGRAEIASKGFTDAAFSYLPEADIRQQLLLAQEVENEILGNSTGFRPAEGWLDPLLVSLLKEMGFNWAITTGSTLFNMGGNNDKLFFHLLKQKGLNDLQLDILCTFENSHHNFPQHIKETFLGQIDVKQFVNNLFRLGENQKGYRPCMVLEFLMESPLWSDDPRAAVQRFRFFLQCLESIGTFNYSLPSKMLERGEYEEQAWAYPKLNARRLELLLADARDAIAKSQGKNINPSVLKKAWANLLLAESNSAFQIACLPQDALEEKQIAAWYNSYLQACEYAWKTKRSALEI
jgi:hypothetical protein